MRELIKLNDDQIAERFDEMGYGTEADDLELTKETIADFLQATESYSSYKSIDEGVLDTGEPYLVIENAQPIKGQPRTDLMVVDFGDVRACYK